MNLYLDIDGTIITKAGLEAEYLLEFLEYATKNFECYWLTTHCQGNAQDALDYVKDKVSVEVFEKLKKFKPTKWSTLKTEAIDFSKDFIWLDDYMFSSEKEVLSKYGVLDSFIGIDLKSSPKQLLDVINRMTV